MEAGRTMANFEPTNLAEFTTELSSQFRDVMEKGDLEFSIHADVNIGSVYIDREMWEKIIFNLLSNAFKFTFEGDVAVFLKDLPNEVALIVKDSGIGIPQDELPNIFNRFYRVKGAKSRTFEGSGIGLALIKDMVETHGGKITAQSTEGRGTSFTVTIPKGNAHLPVRQQQPQQTLQSTRTNAAVFTEEAARWIPEAAKTNSINNTKPLILVVDDNADMRAYLISLLEQNYNLATASNGIEALRKMQIILPDLIISDIMMPEMDGLALLNELRSSEKTMRIPVILLSARAGNEATVEGLNEGADDYLTKPFASKELLARVNTQLSMVKLRSDLATEQRALFARDEFLSIASHELNTPLTPLKIQLDTLTSVLEKGNLSALTPERLKMMVKVFHVQVNKIANLVSNLLDVTSFATQSLILNRQQINFNELIEKVLGNYSEEITKAKCPIILHLENNVLAYWDPERIQQVITNLLFNALKFAAGRPIKITTQLQQPNVLFTVEDNGPGILPQHFASIFNRYKRIGPNSQTGGLGLGLYICKQIIEAHGGKIKVESQQGKGTKFLVELPLDGKGIF